MGLISLLHPLARRCSPLCHRLVRFRSAALGDAASSLSGNPPLAASSGKPPSVAASGNVASSGSPPLAASSDLFSGKPSLAASAAFSFRHLDLDRDGICDPPSSDDESLQLQSSSPGIKGTFCPSNWRERVHLRVRNQKVVGRSGGFCVPVNVSTLCRHIWFINTGRDVEFSPQAIIHGLELGANFKGANVCEVGFHIIRYGLFTESQCTYEALTGNRMVFEELFKSGERPQSVVHSFQCRRGLSWEDVRSLLMTHPVLASMRTTYEFRSFHGRTWRKPFEEDTKATRPRNDNHCIIMHCSVKDRKGREYVLLENSWGSKWGDKGLVVMPVDIMKGWGLLKRIWYPEMHEVKNGSMSQVEGALVEANKDGALVEANKEEAKSG